VAAGQRPGSAFAARPLAAVFEGIPPLSRGAPKSKDLGVPYARRVVNKTCRAFLYPVSIGIKKRIEIRNKKERGNDHV
jgi:hypothetical protein